MEHTRLSDSDLAQIMPSALQQSGTASRTYTGKTLVLAESTDWSIVRLRSNESVPGLPDETGQCSGGDPVTLCLRPGEWLSLSKILTPQQVRSELMSLALPPLATAYDNTHGLAVFRLQGSGAPWLLSKLSGLDYLAGVNSGTHCAQTRMAHISVLVYFHENSAGDSVFDLLLDRSYARYYWELLLASAPHADELASTSPHY
jgi:heterotetrameric sarcosine oxidase gamma subunit